jgi:hypothetical protein
MNIQNIIGNNLLLFTVNVWIKKPQRDEYPKTDGILRFLSILLAIYESKTLEILEKNELLKHMESPWISILINLISVKPRKTDGIRKHQHHSIYKANQTPSSLP